MCALVRMCICTNTTCCDICKLYKESWRLIFMEWREDKNENLQSKRLRRHEPQGCQYCFCTGYYEPNCVLGLATGSTPIGLYKQLVEWYNKGDLDFSEVMTVNLDEYKGLSRDNDQSYYYFMHQNLFDHVNIPAENTHLPNGMEPDSQKECQEYTNLIQSLGGVDLQLLGIGHNGHIGFNEPGEAFDKQVHCVNLTQSTIEANKRFFASADDVPKQAYTMGIKTIMQAKKILIVASGEDKAEIVRDAFFGPITPKVPASVLQLHNDVTLVADEAALSKLPL